jgi:hypothetical protein
VNKSPIAVDEMSSGLRREKREQREGEGYFAGYTQKQPEQRGSMSSE